MRPPRCRPTARRWNCTAGRYATCPPGFAALDRAALFTALGDEAAATDDNTAAAQAYRAAHELTAGAGDVRAAAALAPRMAAVAHLLGEDLDARVGTLQAALDDLDGSGRRGSGAGPAALRHGRCLHAG